MNDSKLFVGRVVAVAFFAGPHRVISGSIENCCHGVLDQIRRHEFRIGHVGVVSTSAAIWDVPDRSTGHHHVSRGGTDCTNPSPHVMGSVEHHAFRRDPIDVWCVQCRVRIVDLQVEWRLVIDNDEEDVGSFLGSRGRLNEQRQEQTRGGEHQIPSLRRKCRRELLGSQFSCPCIAVVIRVVRPTS